MRKIAVISSFLIIVTLLTSCMQLTRGRTEIDKLFITRLISIDEAAGGKVRITLTTKSLSVGGGQEQAQEGEHYVCEGDTIFDAMRNLSLYSDRRPSFGHTEYILFGESIARKGILPYLDFVSRHNEFRYNTKVYIVKGGTASSLVKNANTPEMYVGDRLTSLEDNISRNSISSIITLNESLLIFDNKNLDTFLPYIEAMSTMTGIEKQGKYDVLLGGYALFRGDKLSYYASEEESRGINWMMNRVVSGLILVKCIRGEEVSMEISNVKVRLKPKIQGDELHCAVDISFSTNIGEIMGKSSVINAENIRYMIKQQNKIIKEEVETAVSIAQKNNSDHFSTITRFTLEYPMLKNYFKENWKELFPRIRFDIAVNSNVKGTYLLNEPTGSVERSMED